MLKDVESYRKAVTYSINLEIELIAQMVEKKEGWKLVMRHVNSAPSIHEEPTLRNLAAAIRARKIPA